MDLDYDPTLPDPLITDLEDAARRIGVPVAQLELLGQDAEIAQAFVDHVSRGTHAYLLHTVNWARLERARARRRQAVIDAVARIAAVHDRRTWRAPEPGEEGPGPGADGQRTAGGRAKEGSA